MRMGAAPRKKKSVHWAKKSVVQAEWCGGVLWIQEDTPKAPGHAHKCTGHFSYGTFAAQTFAICFFLPAGLRRGGRVHHLLGWGHVCTP